jgi:hypothetical protein
VLIDGIVNPTKAEETVVQVLLPTVLGTSSNRGRRYYQLGGRAMPQLLGSAATNGGQGYNQYCSVFLPAGVDDPIGQG